MSNQHPSSSNQRCSDIIGDTDRAARDLDALDDQLAAARAVVARLERARALASQHLARCQERDAAARQQSLDQRAADRLWRGR